ncbi:MarR family winged helix-turn-helix transcriptional regulator [Actinoallomurus oryzae]|uniref:MarR family winged helix-turn-helix transcriptional regulator n=1 Tax=Actinoallomurus oryzae TaxID=502180 RepID=UPI0031F026B5
MTARTVSADEALHVVIAMHRLMRRLRRTGHNGTVHPTQLIVLALLNQYGPLRIGEIARRVPCSQPTATTVVAGLRSAGFVDREADPTDGRATRVAATPTGLAVLRSLAHGEAEVLATLMAELPEDDARLVIAAGPVLDTLADLPAHDEAPLPRT